MFRGHLRKLLKNLQNFIDMLPFSPFADDLEAIG
jgi:hypothetical protein